MNAETSDDIATVAGRLLSLGNPLQDEQVLGDIAKALISAKWLTPVSAREPAPDPISDVREALEKTLGPWFEQALSTAGSALRQHEEHQNGLGLEVSLIDVFSAWGERESRDTAMLIDLCLGAAIEQLGGTAVRIEAARMEELAGSGRIVRLQPEPNVWSVALVPTQDSPVDYARAVEYSRGFDCADAINFLKHIEANRGRAPTYKQVSEGGFPGFFEWVTEGFQNPSSKNLPEKRIEGQPLSSDVSEEFGDSHLDSQDGFDKKA